MGNSAIITTRERKFGLYLHWNGGRDTVGPLLRYCELQGYRPPSEDDYGWARLCQVMGNFFGGSLSLGLGAVSYTHLDVYKRQPCVMAIHVVGIFVLFEKIISPAHVHRKIVSHAFFGDAAF